MIHQSVFRLSISLIIFILLVGCRGEGVNFVFPEGFEGWAVLITNCENGSPSPQIHSEGQIDIVFPPNGVLIGNFDQPSGHAWNRFYIIERGNRKKLATPDSFEESEELKLCSIIASRRAGFNPTYFGDEKLGSGKTSDTWWEYDFVFFFVGDTCSNRVSFDQFQDDLNRYLVNNNIGSCY